MRKLTGVIAFTLSLMLALSCIGCLADAEESITVCNWYDYIDEGVLEMFEAETGIHVNYICATTNEEMYTKLTSGAGTYDLIFPSEYLIERLIKEDRLETLNHENIPNLSCLMPRFQNPDYDPGCTYSVPYMWGTLGILYNTEMVDGEITGWKDLFDEKYAGQVIMMNSVRDTLAIGLIMNGWSLNSRDEEQLRTATDMLVAQKENDQIAGYLLDETKDKMVAGEAAIGVVYSGDAVYAIEKNPALRYVVPEEGSNIWVDGVCIPKGAQNKSGAEKFINFLCRDDISQLNLDYIGYCTPNAAVAEALDPEDPTNYVMNPTDEEVSRCEYYFDVSDINDLLEELWMEIMRA